MKDILKVYNKEPEKKFDATITRTLPYSTALFRDVPRTKLKSSDPRWQRDKCWHCQEFPRIIAETDVIVWCERCYLKHFEKMDGTYIQHDAVPALKKLLQDHKEGKLKDVPMEPQSMGIYVQE